MMPFARGMSCRHSEAWRHYLYTCPHPASRGWQPFSADHR